jgi:hypothetical protein
MHVLEVHEGKLWVEERARGVRSKASCKRLQLAWLQHLSVSSHARSMQRLEGTSRGTRPLFASAHRGMSIRVSFRGMREGALRTPRNCVV